MDSKYAIIVAHDQSLGIGLDNQLPWHIKGDMKFFRQTTCHTPDNSTINQQKNAVIMGRKTWESLPGNFKPLPDRINVVLSKNVDYQLPDTVIRDNNIENALAKLAHLHCPTVFVIGGAAIYEQAIKITKFNTLYITEIEGTYNCDTFFPEYRNDFKLINSSPLLTENTYKYSHKTYIRK